MPRDGVDEWARISRPYPIPVRLYENEEFDSFSRRALAANLEDERHKRILTNAAAPFFPEMKRPKQWKELLLVKTGVRRELFERATPRELRHHDGTTCAGCQVGTGDQWMCRECAGGELVELQPHLERLVCVEHGLWVGSGTKPEDQFKISAKFIEAEQEYQRLRERQIADAATLWELIHIVDPSLTDEAEHHRMPAAPFPAAVKLWSVLADEAFQLRLFDPGNTYAESLDFLRTSLAVAGFSNGALATRVWHYLRPTALAVREWLVRGGKFATHWEHDFYVNSTVTAQWTAPIRPLDPFSRYLEASGVREITADNWREVLTHRSAGHADIYLRQRANGKLPGICLRGHRIHLYAFVQLGNQSNFRCKCCEGRQAVAGETDITSTHPLRATYFDAGANPGVKATDLVSTSQRRLNWKCPNGHAFPRLVHVQMTSAVDCPTCDEARFTSAEHSLATSCPDAARQWHPTRNTCRPDEVYAKNTKDLFWFTCDNGHDYQSTAQRRTQGYGCKTCAMRTWQRPQRRLSEARPDLAMEWDPELNDGLAFDDVILTDAIIYKWRCKNGHITEKSPSRRIQRDCLDCRGRQRPGEMADKYPVILSEWDNDRNDVDPRDRVDVKAKHVWRCLRAGHIRSATLHTRRNTRGCPDCAPEDRVAFGLEKDEY